MEREDGGAIPPSHTNTLKRTINAAIHKTEDQILAFLQKPKQQAKNNGMNKQKRHTGLNS